VVVITSKFDKLVIHHPTLLSGMWKLSNFTATIISTSCSCLLLFCLHLEQIAGEMFKCKTLMYSLKAFKVAHVFYFSYN